MLRPAVLLAALTLCAAAQPPMADAAVDPAGFQRVASDVVLLRQVARVEQSLGPVGARLRRVTIVAVVVEGRRVENVRVGETIVIDYTVNLTERERAAAEHAQKQGTMPGRQFIGEPDPPQVDGERQFWAHLAPAGQRLGNANRHAGAVIGIADHAFTGKVFVPVAGGLSFVAPM